MAAPACQNPLPIEGRQRQSARPPLISAFCATPSHCFPTITKEIVVMPVERSPQTPPPRPLVHNLPPLQPLSLPLPLPLCLTHGYLRSTFLPSFLPYNSSLPSVSFTPSFLSPSLRPHRHASACPVDGFFSVFSASLRKSTFPRFTPASSSARWTAYQARRSGMMQGV